MKPRLFVFGDSWAFNYFKNPWDDELKKFSENYEYFGHWIDHMNLFYDVISFAKGGSSNEEIIYQLSNLPEYQDGDRILIIFAPPGRFSWIENKKQKGNYLIKTNSFFEKQYLNRHEYWVDDTIENNQKKFISMIPKLFKEYNPLMFSWFKDTALKIESIEYIEPNENYTTIYEDSNGLCSDKHLGLGGNYELFKMFANKLGIEIENYKFEYKGYKKQKI